MPLVLQEFNNTHGGKLSTYNLEVDYKHFTVHDTLKLLFSNPTMYLQANDLIVPELKSINEIPSSYEQIGHIAHMNLREEVLMYKYIIGQIILDKNATTIRTVINKTNSITNEYRVFPMEIIAGEPNYAVKLIQCGAKFEFEFDKVYWNSRLSTEHERIVKLMCSFSKNGDCEASNNPKRMKLSAGAAAPSQVDPPVIIADMMCGVGPFAIPLSMKDAGVIAAVHANDLNPDPYQARLKNSSANHCNVHGMHNTKGVSQNSQLAVLHTYNLDGREFIRRLDKGGVAYTDVIMNLPATAVEFLDVFIGRNASAENIPIPGDMVLPRIHVYAFSSASNPIYDVIARVCGILSIPCTPQSGSEDAVDVNNLSTPLGNMIMYDTEKSSSAYKDCLDFITHRITLGAYKTCSTSYCLTHIVRDVAPKKVMVCLSFIMPLEVLCRQTTAR